MKKRPVVGIITQTQDPITGQTPFTWIMGHSYIRVLTAAGCVPWLIPLLPDDEPTLQEIYDRLDGVFLTGGVDVDPSEYHEQRHILCGKTDPPRDKTETWMVQRAQADKKPILGVCRGLQLINVANGGTLYQDIGEHLSGAIKHDYFPCAKKGYTRDYLAHAMDVDRQTVLGDILETKSTPVNSMHHQGIKDLAAGFRATAYAPDGLIEAIESANGGFVVAVQWHPEELTQVDKGMKRLFDAFADAARAYA